MKLRKLLEEAKELAEAGDEVLLCTVTGCSGEEGEGVIGEKVLLAEKREPKTTSENLRKLASRLVGNTEELFDQARPELEEVDLEEKGRFKVFCDPVQVKERLIIFGGGHIALPLAKIGYILDFSVTVVDDRGKYANNKRFPRADEVVYREFDDFVEDFFVRPTDYLVVVTRGHQYDYELVKNLIGRGARYLGMIGSHRKVNILSRDLKEKEGISSELIEGLHAPIGLDISADTPEEIAVAIAAELVERRRKDD